MKPFWITFYSYKGGVGRSMAVANLAALLARRSRRIFMIDFDLEAPGLDSFREFGVERAHPGVVEYAHEFQKTGVAPDIEPFVMECGLGKSMSILGNLWLMTSGRKDEAYNSKRMSLNWEALYESGVGRHFIENWKAAIFRRYKPDYVFVDSRTGLTDVGGICTLHLPDLVALLFGLNDQNLHGIEAVLNIIRRGTSTKPPQVLPVATPVPNMPMDENGPFAKRLREVEKTLGLKIERTISYNPQAALVEKLFTLNEESESLRIGREYSQLLDDILKRAPDGIDGLIAQSQLACDKDDEASADRIKKVLLADFEDRADARFTVGQIERRFRGREEALEHWRMAFELDPSHGAAFTALSAYYKQKGRTHELLEMHEKRLAYAEQHLAPQRVSELRRQQGEDLMAVGRFTDAATTYARASEALAPTARTLQRLSASLMMTLTFNKSEAERRLLQQVNPEAWEEVVKLFEEGVNIENLTPDVQANMLQAMHIPYACLGNRERAFGLLDKAEKYAQLAGKGGTIFCVKTYTSLSVDEFLATNEEMKTSLHTGKLWDGMPVPDPILKTAE